VSCLSACWEEDVHLLALSYDQYELELIIKSDQLLEALIAVAPALYLLRSGRGDNCGGANPQRGPAAPIAEG